MSTTPTATSVSMDDLDLNRFHKKIVVYSAGGPFIDGYILSIIGVALIQASPQLGLTAFTEGLVAAAALLGIFIGATAGGLLSDRFGRQRLYMYDLLLIALLSAATFWVDSAWMLIVMRLILGIAIGADYPLASSMLTEFIPARYRGPFLGLLITMFFVGAAVAYTVGEILKHTGDDAWRWMLASSAVPALLIALMRIGTPESPRWLANKGRMDEAQAVVTKVFGPGVTVPETETKPVSGGLGALVRSGYFGRMVFVATFWTCSILPLFAIYAFGPQILGALGFGETLDTLGSSALNILFTISCAVSLILVNRVGRRGILIGSFAISAVALLVLGIFPNAGIGVVMAMFALYGLAIGGTQILQWIYPNELFPTEIRGSAVGIASALSRIGAAVGTFLLPLAISGWGIGPTMLAAAAITFVGLAVSVVWAPETRGQTLEESSSLK